MITKSSLSQDQEEFQRPSVSLPQTSLGRADAVAHWRHLVFGVYSNLLTNAIKETLRLHGIPGFHIGEEQPDQVKVGQGERGDRFHPRFRVGFVVVPAVADVVEPVGQLEAVGADGHAGESLAHLRPLDRCPFTSYDYPYSGQRQQRRVHDERTGQALPRGHFAD